MPFKILVALLTSIHLGAFANAVYGDGERDSGPVLPIQTDEQIQSSRSEDYQELSTRPEQQPYQSLQKVKVQPNIYDIDSNEVNGREQQRPTAHPDEEAAYIDVDSAIQRDRPSYASVDCKVLNETTNSTTKPDPEYFELEKPSTDSDPVDPVYFQLEKGDSEANEQVGDESLQDYDRLGAAAATPHLYGGHKNAATDNDTYQHLKSHVTPVSDDDDYQHLKRDGY